LTWLVSHQERANRTITNFLDLFGVS